MNIKKIKIGLIGNMNNNNFAFLRYLKDLDYDVTLLLMANDGKGKSSHFSVESDCWEMDKWSSFIRRTKIYEHPISALNFPFSWLVFAYLLLGRVFKKKELAFPIRKRKILETFEDFDILIGSGITPAVFNRVNKKLTVFYPYAVGVEYLNSSAFLKHLNSQNPFQKLIAKDIFLRQKNGLEQTRIIFTSSCKSTSDTFQKFNISFTASLIPTVYNKEKSLADIKSEFDLIAASKGKDNFIVLSHARHVWKKPSNINDEQWNEENKHNDWIIKSFAKFLIVANYKAKLIMFEYGQDVAFSKHLCDELGLADHVIWLPVMQRKKILKLIGEIDVGVGEFLSIPGVSWGSTLIEFMCKGKPVIHGCLIDKENFTEEFRMPFPPLLEANSELEIYDQLIYLYKNDFKRKQHSKESLEWFNSNYGTGLANSVINEILINYEN